MHFPCSPFHPNLIKMKMHFAICKFASCMFAKIKNLFRKACRIEKIPIILIIFRKKLYLCNQKIAILLTLDHLRVHSHGSSLNRSFVASNE